MKTFLFRTTIFMIGILIFQLMSACAPLTAETQTQKPQSTTFPRVTIPDSEVRQIKSSATGRSYDIYILLPTDYGQNQIKYPVLYVLDGQWDFKLLDSIYGGLLYDNFIPEMIIVGITYSGDNPDYNALRAMDYTPVNDMSIPGSGGAPKFLAFFKEELIPFIESNYRADASQRVLMGSSYGGSFTLYALFSEPGLFSGYVAASPVVVYGDGFAFTQEAQYAKNHQDLPIRLFLSVGELESLNEPVQGFTQVLKARNYTGLKLDTRIIEGERHAGNKPEAFNRGLRFVFGDK